MLKVVALDMDKIRDRIKQNIAEQIKLSRKTQTDIAREMDVSVYVLNNYVIGRAVPTVFTLIKLCQVLDCEYEEILGNRAIGVGI